MEPVVLNNRYRLLELIGSGGMAVVYRGVDTLLQRQVAVKVLREQFSGDPAFLARFQREARSAANLDHPNIVTVYDVGQDGDRHYIVMEYVRGQDLKTLVRQKGRLTVDEALDIAAQIAGGVGHAHKAGVIHCDIKPQNVLVTQDGRVKVTDFGIARALSESGLTESEVVWGSPLYFSPEQAAGDPPSPASDVYSIGVVMYEMLAGLPPFQAEKPAALALMHMREDPPPLTVRSPQVPRQLEWIVRKVLAKEPAARYRTAGQLAHVLEEYRKHGEQVTGWQRVVPAPDYPADHVANAGADRAARPALSPESEAALDRLTWVLGVIAFFAVAGLVLLWAAVYRAYSAPRPLLSPPTPSLSAPLVTLTPTTQLVSVPNVVGELMDEARRIVERAGLRLVVQGERDEPGIEGGLVLEQSPAPGERRSLDSEVFVVVGRLGRELVMPSVLDYSVDAVQGGLESDGLNVAVAEVWSMQPEGMVVAQEPGPGTTVHAGDTVTLTVSGGIHVRIPLEVNLDNQIVLESAELPQRTVRPGDRVGLTLRWRALRSIDMRYVVFVHFVDDPHGPPLAQQDVEPIIPTTEWAAGTQVADPHQVTIPSDQPAGVYQLRVGMYPQGRPNYQLPAVDAGLTTVESGRILIAEVEVRP